MKLFEYPETRLPTYDVDLEAPPDVRWKHIAQKEAKNIGRLLDDVVGLCSARAGRAAGPRRGGVGHGRAIASFAPRGSCV